MTRLLSLLFALAVNTALISPVLADPDEITLAVKNMDCASCPVVVRAALYDLDGVEDVQVSMAEKTVEVVYDSALLTTDKLADAVSNAGFPAELVK